MIDDGGGEQEFDDGDHASDADFEGSPAKKKPKDDEELPQAPVDGGARGCQAAWTWATGAASQEA